MKAGSITFGMSDLAEHHMLLLSSTMRLLQSHNPSRLRRVLHGGDITFVSIDSAIGKTLGETQRRRQRLFVPIIKAGQSVPSGVDYYLRYPFKTAHVVALIGDAKNRTVERVVDAPANQTVSTRRNIKTQAHLGERLLYSQRDGVERWKSNAVGSIQIDWSSRVVQTSAEFADCAGLSVAVDEAGRSFFDDVEDQVEAGSTLHLAPFLWKLGLASANHSFMKGHLATHAVRLIRWPDFGVVPEARAYMRLFSLLGKRPVSLEFLEQHGRMETDELVSVVAACVMSGLTEAHALPDKEQPRAAKAQVSPPGFLSRIRRALGMADGTANAG